jgi:ectoine hydroxylase-related dioxygenase (phytanoyl-CoA dioxygenase family)
MSKLARPITPDEVAAYRHAGVVLLRGILDLASVNALRRIIDDAVVSTGSGNERGKDGCFSDTDVASRVRDFKRFILSGPGPEISAALLDSEKVNFFGDQIFVKEPGARERTAFRQDATHLEIDGDQCCVLWIPADPVTMENGGMMYWRGSHKSGTVYQPNVSGSQAPRPGAEGEVLPDIEGHLADYDIVHFDVEPGDVIVHHYRTVYGAGANTSRYQVCRAASLRYCGDDIRFQARPWAPRQLHHTTHLNDGDPLGGADFPVVWRRRQNQEAA